MGIGNNYETDRTKIFNNFCATTPYVSYKNSLSTAQRDTSVFVSDNVDSRFAENVINQYADLAGKNKTVKNVVILSSPDLSEVDEMKELDNKSKETIKDYIQNGAEDAYGFYTKKSDTIVIIQSNHNRKEEKYEGTLEEQGADTMLHEYAHLLDTNISSSKEYKQAYLADLKSIEEQLKQNPDAKIGNSDMTYREAMIYFDHYYEGADFSDGIDENDVTRRGLRENFAESYATVFDNCKSDVNAIYKALFPNTTDFVREFVA